MTKKAAKKATAKKKAAKKTPSKATATKGDLQAVKDLGTANDKLKAELSKTIVGMDNVIEETLIAIFSRGHALLEGVPGLANPMVYIRPARIVRGFLSTQYFQDRSD